MSSFENDKADPNEFELKPVYDIEDPNRIEKSEELPSKPELSTEQRLLQNNEAFISFLNSFRGSMPIWQHRCNNISGVHGDLIRLFDSWLRGIGQVAFLNNPVCGLGILCCAIWDSPWNATCGIVSSFWVTLLAFILLPNKRDLYRDGLFTFNPYLLGACWATFVLSPWDYRLIVIILFYSPIVLVTQNALMKFFGTFESPAFTLPYIVHALTFLVGIYNFNLYGPKSSPAVLSSRETTLQFEFQILLDAFSQGVGQVYFIAKTGPGLTTLVFYLLNSPFHALGAILGSSLGLILGYILGGQLSDIQAGLWGFNPVLSYTAIFAEFLRPTWSSCVYGFLCSLASVILYGGLKSVLSLGNLPTLTLPFSVATVLFMVARHAFPLLEDSPPPPPPPKDERSRLLD
eukprot:TRINITY_DN18494_c0_g1_i1.p1 TRINITY_DN18494_c0_g1~~TRINITY_DN18494_c0_g1_i1.p1  ORF type:complete len:403 (-),score=47.62 TRINITY_DN18494_c0_g1_i1:157-1365(-)